MPDALQTVIVSIVAFGCAAIVLVRSFGGFVRKSDALGSCAKCSSRMRAGCAARPAPAAAAPLHFMRPTASDRREQPASQR